MNELKLFSEELQKLGVSKDVIATALINASKRCCEHILDGLMAVEDRLSEDDKRHLGDAKETVEKM